MTKAYPIQAAVRIPVYMQIENALRSAIENGVYGPGDQLPSETELAKRFGTTRSTVTHALSGLVYERIIERHQGSGTFVAQASSKASFDASQYSFFEQSIMSSGLSLAYRVVDFEEVPHNPHVNAILTLSERESLYRLRRIRVVEGKPLALEVRYIPALTAVRINRALLQELPLQVIFVDHLGIILASCPTIVRVGLATEEAIEFLNVQPGRPVFMNEHTFQAENGKLELWGVSTYTEDFQLRYAKRLLPGDSPETRMEIRLESAPAKRD